MAKGWKNESRRHSFASKGIKTAQKIPKLPKNLKEKEGITEYYRDAEGKISNDRLSSYGKRRLAELQGVTLHFTDTPTVVVKNDELISKDTGEVVAVIDNDRLINKIVFRVIL